MMLWGSLALLLWGILRGICAQDFYVAAPSTLRLNSDETVAISIDGNRAAIVNISVQDHPGRLKIISENLVPVEPGEPKVFKIRLDVDKFPPDFLKTPGLPKLVSLNAHFENGHKEILIPISLSQSGFMFVQTDKPIYTPSQIAFIRIISLTEETLPSNELFKLQIRNPDNIVVEEKIFNDNNKRLNNVFENHVYRFPTYPVLGNWSATVRYGYNLNQNSTVRFELREYVLPTFTVDLKTPDVILPDHTSVQVDVEAKYVYGRNVKGIVYFRLGLKRKHSSEVVFFAVINPKQLYEGAYKLIIKTKDLKSHDDVGWFPGIEESHLVVEATVVDLATGNKEVAINSKVLFTKSPFVISFKRCLGDFRPGLTSVFEADITYVDGKPANGVCIKVKAVADNGKVLRTDNKESGIRSDENGKVYIEIQPEIHHETVNLTLETNDTRYEGSQAKGSFVQRAYKSKSKAYIALARKGLLRLQPGDTFGKEVHFEPAGIENIHCLVVARGKILSMKKLKSGAYKHQRVEFKITHDMVPSFRVVVFAHHVNELIADSLKIDVKRECHPDAKVDITTEFSLLEPEPGSSGKIIIKGTKDTAVGFLAVDEAVYALSKQDLLTRAKVFDRFESHDLGCGPGGGVDINSVLGKAGITIGTNKFTPSHTHSCVEVRRKKRAAAQEITKAYSEKDKQCCALGIEKDVHSRTCEERVPIIDRLDTEHPNCSKIFLECCLQGKDGGLTDMIMKHGNIRGRMKEENLDDLDFLDIEFDEEDERQATKEFRSDFKETWIYNNVIIGPDGKKEAFYTLPHSITTWVIQAVSVSPTDGICVAEPKRLVTFKKLFLHLNLPYSVVRNEQVEIQATVFNYIERKVKVTVFMYGTKGICSGLQDGEKSERKSIIIDPKSSETVTFPIIPLEAGEFPIKVAVITAMGSDAIQKKLNVVFEGIPKEVHVSVKLDPTNQQRRKKREIETLLYTDYIDDTQNHQMTTVKLSIPEGFVPGTASCSIKAVGDTCGTAVDTAIENPDRLLIEPSGCGEQNIAKLAPTLYAMRYLKVTGKLTADREEKGYKYIRQGYGNQLNFRKKDGSYAAQPTNPTSTWLTAFVMKVFCQASRLVHIDENVICSGIRWLIRNQELDGSYIEKHASYKKGLMGGIHGPVSMTAFALIALQECSCNEEELLLAKTRAAAYLEGHLDNMNIPLSTAVVAYALSLSDSNKKDVANEKLLSEAKYNQSYNWMYWTTENSAEDIETAGYALLNQLMINDMDRSRAIVNWLNSKQQQSGAFKSTQDTVIALQALTEYATRAHMPSINLVSNISSSNDRNFLKVFQFHKDNALVLQDAQVTKVGGTLFIQTGGHGVGYLSVKLRYNLNEQSEDNCKFDITVNVTEAIIQKEDPLHIRRRARIPDDMISSTMDELQEDPPSNHRTRDLLSPEGRTSFNTPTGFGLGTRTKRQSQVGNDELHLNISLCVRYLGDKDTEMSIVDVEIFSGFEPVVADLKKLENDPRHLIQRFEKSVKGVVFYLEKVPKSENYCFSFNVIRQYLVGRTHRSVIKVYDYYNPDASCSKFYIPPSNSPLLRTFCQGGICECAEGGCPPKNPFSRITDPSSSKRREELRNIFCENYNYVWNASLSGPVQKHGGFLNISISVQNVIKAGIEKAEDIEGETRTLLARDNCEIRDLFRGVMYLILGRDGQAYKNPNGETWYRYLLDQSSVVHRWSVPRQSSDHPRLQRDLMYVTRKLKEKGCET